MLKQSLLSHTVYVYWDVHWDYKKNFR